MTPLHSCFLRYFRDPIQVPTIENRVPINRIRENYQGKYLIGYMNCNETN